MSLKGLRSACDVKPDLVFEPDEGPVKPESFQLLIYNRWEMRSTAATKNKVKSPIARSRLNHG